jgi:hypothetical protein
LCSFDSYSEDSCGGDFLTRIARGISGADYSDYEGRRLGDQKRW